MNKYIGLKSIQAKAMNRLEYSQYRNWELPADENGADEGYLVEYLDSPNQNHADHQGYVSWSPKEVFEKAYRQVTGLTFGIALEALKRGKRIARKGWNSKGMFLFLKPGGNPPKTAIHDPALRAVINEKHPDSDTFPALPSIRMFTATGEVLTGWLASQTDMLSEDWEILE